ncbi:MAG TPA: hypothetical protein VIA62_05355 [Thermoanaerobaculia bacterium]|jgi:hypothetical protein|nr:hypothetical protein [Thermoanaerobaculia bacterium]
MNREPQDDELLRSYLLGDLPEEDADRLEGRLLADDDLFDLAEAVEADLLAALDRGELAPAEGERVRRRLASSPRGQGRLAFARSLNALAGETAGDRKVLPFPRRAPAFPPPAIRWIALAASLVMLIGLGWFAWQHRTLAPGTTSAVAAKTPAPLAPPQAATPRPANPVAAQTPTASVPGATRQAPQPAVAPAVLTLSFVTSRGAETEAVPQLRLSPGTRMAEIQIDAEGLDAARSFGVVVRSKGRGTVMEKKGLALRALDWGQALVLHVPAARLPAGRYEVAVTPQGGSEVAKDFEVVDGKR